MTHIIYPYEDTIMILTSTGELPLQDVAFKDVPAGLPYLFIETADIPADSFFAAAWEADFSNPDGHGLGADAYFAAKEANQ